jgi:uncharacterized protein YndB with AHSA1/START domain
MSANSAGSNIMQQDDLVITRTFDAPRELVFKMWTDPKRLARWWGPKDFTNPRCEMDARPGGLIYIEMRGPDKMVYPMKGVVHEIEEPKRLVFSGAALDKNGNPIFEVRNAVTFDEQGGKTKLTMRAHVIKMTAEADQYLKGQQTGWNQSLDRLAHQLKTS